MAIAERPAAVAPVSSVPPGWDANPSAWRGRHGRLPVLCLSLVGLAVALTLTLYQLGVLQEVWEPFFGDGSQRVLHSAVSRLLPLPDASLGAIAYVLDAIFASLGGTMRWRTAPWAVCAQALVVLPTACGSVGLLMIQPLLAHAWCSLCLVSALVSIALAGPTLTELLATLQHLKRVWREGHGFWRPLWGEEAV
ncbi:MAG TPA: vitamin K epoxide reductase family protein [Oscillatoriaceae cyanobacterium]